MRIGSLLSRLLMLLAGAVGLMSAASAAEPSAAFKARAAELVELLNGKTDPAKFFSPAFLRQVPAAQVSGIAEQLRTGHGAALAITRIEARNATSGSVFVELERAAVQMEMVIGAAPPHLVEGLVIATPESKADSVAAIFGEITALPGQISIAAAKLEEAGPSNFLTQHAETPMAIGSAFKLFVLAELVRSVKAGERRWSEVVPLDRRSLPSGILQDWPEGSPLTVHSLAALMISQSDNSATDTLLHLLGREKVEALLPTLGVRAPERNRPFLSTREAFALKGGDSSLLGRWRAGDEAARRAMLTGEVARAYDGLDPASFGGQPNAIADVEWFASTSDMVRTLDWLRRNGDRTALDILAINPGLGRPAAEGFGYLGFKGGSEPGVINMSFLLHNREGRWLALSASWNDETAPLDEARFIGIIGRFVALLR
jgi:beta-lactamase class A